MSVWESRFVVSFWLAAVLGPLSASPALAQSAFDELVDCRWTVEEVLWRHRIWPESNPGPKPPLDEVLSREAVARRMDDALRQATALEDIWGSPVDEPILQRELDRMAANSRDPEMLQELFTAVGSGERAALCLALPTLARNRLDAFYATDPEIHRPLREEAELGLAQAADVDGLADYGAEVSVETFARAREEGDADRGIGPSGERYLAEAAWRFLVGSLQRSFLSFPEATTMPTNPGDSAARLPVGRTSPLTERDTGFLVREVREATDDRLTVATALWRKRPVDAWWQEHRLEHPRARLDGRAIELRRTAVVDCVDDSWRPTPDWTPPSPRYHHVAVWTGSEMLIWSGSIETVKYYDGRRYDPATDSWSPLGAHSTPPDPRHLATAVWTGTQMIVWGGYRSAYLGNGGRYNPLTDAWTPTNPTGAPTPRAWHTAVWTGSEMVVWGGYDGGYLSTGARYDPSTNTWQGLAASPPAARAYHTAVWAGAPTNRMIVWGGSDANGARGDGAEYAPGGGWTTMPVANAPGARSLHTAVWTGSQMIVWGGYDGANALKTGGRYTSAGGWNATPLESSSAPAARRYHRAVWAGPPSNRMIVWGGYDGGPRGDGGLYDPATNSWTPTSLSGAPTARWGHSLVWTGSEAIVWGGGSNAPLGYFQSGGRYDPATDSWRSTTVSATPSPRLEFASTWTGAELFVWGGIDEVETLASGGRYVPATDTWISTAASDAATVAGARATAVWTGTEVLVWGGLDAASGRYSPSADSWDPLPTAPVAMLRHGHSAVWTGTEMIVVGGQMVSPPFAAIEDGGRFSPNGSSWALLASGLGPRAYHTAVWTGREMLVWGKPHGAGDPLGSRYYPPLQSWTPMSASGAPLTREFHEAVWTRDEMIVWGGATTSQNTDTGGRYDPLTDAWQATPLEQAPGPRSLTASVWTGSEFIVWGGLDGGALSSGGRYTPGGGWSPLSGAGAPAARYGHVAAWTGSRMIVWGGGDLLDFFSSGGLYCAYTPAIFRDDFESANFFWWSVHP